MSWSIDERIAETQFHIDGLRSIILGHEMSQRPCPDISRILSYCMGVLYDKREELARSKARPLIDGGE